MAKVQSINEIYAAWKAEGRTFRPGEVTAEWKRQGREALRERESAVLVAAERPDASDRQRELAAMVREHRAAGSYTTQG